MFDTMKTQIMFMECRKFRGCTKGVVGLGVGGWCVCVCVCVCVVGGGDEGALCTCNKHRLQSGNLAQSFDRASDVCQRSNMLRKLTCIAGSSYSSNTLYEIVP